MPNQVLVLLLFVENRRELGFGPLRHSAAKINKYEAFQTVEQPTYSVFKSGEDGHVVASVRCCTLIVR